MRTPTVGSYRPSTTVLLWPAKKFEIADFPAPFGPTTHIFRDKDAMCLSVVKKEFRLC